MADHKSLQDSSGRENDSLRHDLDRYKRLYKETAEELQTKEEVHSALKRTSSNSQCSVTD